MRTPSFSAKAATLLGCLAFGVSACSSAPTAVSHARTVATAVTSGRTAPPTTIPPTTTTTLSAQDQIVSAVQANLAATAGHVPSQISIEIDSADPTWALFRVTPDPGQNADSMYGFAHQVNAQWFIAAAPGNAFIGCATGNSGQVVPQSILTQFNIQCPPSS